MNLNLVFNHPWLLLLIIPAFALIFVPHFRHARKYRRTRNRLISLVLMSLVMILSVSVLAGATFNYTENNYENELIILVDVSDSNNNATQTQEKNLFVQNVVKASAGDYKVGVITYAKDYAYVSKMSFDTKQVIDDYLKSYLANGETSKLDKSGTNLAQAVYRAKELITNTNAAKVLILSDGIETDGEGLSAVMSLVLDGVKVDTAYFPADEVDREFQINFVQYPNYNLFMDEEFTLTLTTQSTHMTEVKIYVEDNGQYVGRNSAGEYTYYNKDDSLDESAYKTTYTIQKDIGSVTFKHKFNSTGAHELRFHIEGVSDSIAQNNTYISYYYLEVVNRILVIQNTDEGEELEKIIENEYKFTSTEGSDSESSENGKLTVTNFGAADCPKNIIELTNYDQVILVNISNNDIPEGFVDILNTYVHDFGGGLFTVGGNKYDKDGTMLDEANAYNYEYNTGTDFERMLPVQTVSRYVPPKAVLFIIDNSQSMEEPGDATRTRMQLAIMGAKQSLGLLNPRDYVGVIQFNTTAKIVCDMVPYAEKYKAEKAIDSISPVGGTYYTPAFEYATSMLATFSRAKKKHIIFITDGEPSDYASRNSGYLKQIDMCYNAGISLSALYIGDNSPTMLNEIRERIEAKEGVYEQVKVGNLYTAIAKALETPEVTDYVSVPFYPVVEQYTKVVEGITDLPELDGFYGVEAKASATVPITGDYAPLYAQWTYGKGKVGSFMSDLNGKWSSKFLDKNEHGERGQGVQLILNIIRELFPSQCIKYTEIKASITTRNYMPLIQVEETKGLSDGQYYNATITYINQAGNTTIQTIKELTEAGQLYKGEYTVSEAGVYLVTIQKNDKSGKSLDSYSTHTVFSYSAEYDAFVSAIKGENFLTELANKGSGSVVDISDPGSVLTAVTDIPMTYDPRVPIIITVIILFLLDVAVRKFKFKWPWEIIRDRREKKRIAEVKARRANVTK